MANFLSVRRVKVQEIDEDGNDVGSPDFGILASDDYEQGFTVSYRSLEELNEAIRTAGNILDVVGGFWDVSRGGIGYKNYSGNPGCT